MASSEGFLLDSETSFSDEFYLDSKLLIDPKLLFVGPKIGEGAHAKFIGACKEPVMVVVTELLLGGSLRKYLLSMRPRCLDMQVAVSFALDIAQAMECLHSHGIIHRDLKPENLLLTEDHKTVKLVDFGLAREESLTEMMTAETGTYRWMAPELYSTVTLRHGEKKHYNHKVDAYSFAIVLWELLHNRMPFEGMSNLQAAYAAAFKNVRPSADNLPEDLASLLTSCWQEDPNSRPNFSQIVKILQDFLHTISPPTSAVSSHVFSSDNVLLPPESPGTSSLMAIRDNLGEMTKMKLASKSKAFFFCFKKCC
ncbi:Serine/threonine-protein kinase [Nymphaea thermarum]|nr:Serine/threonine-protein kinase [Nymphaea thermarum]